MQFILGALILLIGSSSYALSYSYKTLINKYLETSTTLNLQKSKHIQATEAYKKTKLEVLPKLDVAFDKSTFEYPSYQSSPFFPKTTYSLALNVTQQLYLGGRIWRTISISSTRKEMSKLQLEATKEAELLRIANKLIDLHLSQKKLSLFKESQTVQKEFLKITKRKYKKGNSKVYELEQAKSDYLSYFSKIKNIELVIASMEYELSSLLGLKDNSISFLSSLQLNDIKPLVFEKALSKSIEQRKDFQLVLKTQEESNLNKKLTMGSHLPSLSITGVWGYKATELDTLTEDTNSSSSVILGLRIPLFSGFTSFKDRNIENENIYQAGVKINELKLDINSQVKNALINIKEMSEIYNKNTSWYKSANRALNSAKKSFKYGTIDHFQIVQLQRGREIAKVNQLESEFALLKTKLNYHYSLGNSLTSALSL